MKNNGPAATEYRATGIGAAPGVAIGPAYVVDQGGVPVPEYTIATDQIEAEIDRLDTATAKARRQLMQLKQKAALLPTGAEDIALLLDTHLAMLDGSRLLRGAAALIRAERLNAEAAIQRQVKLLQAGFKAMDDAYLAARAEDIGDVGLRLLRQLLQQQYNPFEDAPPGCIVIAEQITPADAALMNDGRVAGFATVLGGAEGHAAIMARALGLPAIFGSAGLTPAIRSGDLVILDGRRGEIIARPEAATLAHYRQEVANKQDADARLRGLRDLPAVTLDGAAIGLQANIETLADAQAALAAGAAGIGLLRTEFLFMNRNSLPDEEEQYNSLRQIVLALAGRPLTVRTLDVGGEKLSSALDAARRTEWGEAAAASANPALGLRAIRLSLKEPHLLETQLAAILRAGALGPVRILIPMVSSASQMAQVRRHLASVTASLQRRGVKLGPPPPLGAMIEIPAAALAADALAKVCDFFAIGSNDLTQYTLAIDRGDDQVADLYDPFHPGVLRLLQFTAAAAWRANISVSLCGEIAGDRRATALLLGLGLRELSMSPLRLPAVKEEIRSLALPPAVALAERIMGLTDEAEIRAAMKDGVAAG